MALYKYVVWGGSEEGLLVKVSIKLEIPLKTVERHITAMKKMVFYFKFIYPQKMLFINMWSWMKWMKWMNVST